MYQNIYYNRRRNEVHLWDDTIGYTVFPYERYAYIDDPNGDCRFIDGKPATKIYEWSDLDVNSGLIHGHDVDPETRTLIDLYGDSDEFSINHRIMFIDIEVEKIGKHCKPEEATNPISSIAAGNYITGEIVVFLRSTTLPEGESKYGEYILHVHRTERELLDAFINYYSHFAPTIISGWNVLWFDLVYLYNRSNHIYGGRGGSWLSPVGIVDSYLKRNGDAVFKVAGVSCLDGLLLYKNFTASEKPRHTLDYISTIELGEGKVKYEGSLDSLYLNDIHKFIEYNVMDVILPMRIDKKLDFISIAMGLAHKGHVSYENALLTSKYTDGACICEAEKMGFVVRSNMNKYGEKGEGALVKTPAPGIYSWVYDLDLKSLYPFTIITLNISPETKRGRVLEWDIHKFVNNSDELCDVVFIENSNETYTMSYVKLREVMSGEQLSVSGNGILYSTKEVGLIPSILQRWMNLRDEYRALADKYHKDGDKDKQLYYDRKQLIEKINANSLYGVLLLPSWRFYDRENGEATTVTGQKLITYTQQVANKKYDEICNTSGVDYCIYSDTDSIFYSALTLITAVGMPCKTDDEIADACVTIAKHMQDYINDSYDEYATMYHGLNKHHWKIKQELVADRAFWGTAKKRYAMHLVREGTRVINKYDIKGFDSVRSSFPAIFRTALENVLKGILDGLDKQTIELRLIDLYDSLYTTDISQIMNPTSVNGIVKYDDGLGGIVSGAPVHVKAAIYHNRYIADHGDPTISPIYDADKLLWAYLTSNPYGFPTMAYRGYEDDTGIVDILKKFIDIDKLFTGGMVNKVQSIFDSLQWGELRTNKNFILRTKNEIIYD